LFFIILPKFQIMKKIFTLLIVLSYISIKAQCYNSITSKGLHNISIKSDGTMWAWGRNDEDQIGDNSNTDQLSPIQVGIDNNWVTVSAGTYYSAAIKADGTLWAWGSNSSGQTGPISADIPQMIGMDDDWVSVSTGLGFTSAIKSNGTLLIWGFNNYGQLGNGTTINSNTPAQVGNDTDWIAVSNGSQHVLTLKSDGTLWSWGLNDAGQLGHDDEQNMYVPTQVGTESDWTNISAGYAASAAIKANGTLWVWGYNEYGMVGDGTTIDRYAPTQVGIETDWSSVAITTHTMAIKANGTLWAWGRNNYGKIGNGLSTGSQLTPVQIGSDTDWIMAVPGFEHSIAIKGNGTIYTWGHNNEGQLGDGTTVDKILPTQIGTTCSETLCTVSPQDLLPVTGECSLELADLTTPTATDNCENTVTATLYTGAFPITENSTIVWKFGNGATAVYKQQEIVIQDTQVPVPSLTTLPEITGQCMVNSDAISAPTALDSCGGTITATTGSELNFDEQGTYTITWTYNDGHGNTVTQNQQVTVEDTEAPVLVAQNITIDLNGAASIAITPEQINNNSSDNCGSLILAIDITTFSALGVYQVMLTGSDIAGNTASATAAVTVSDSSMGIEDIILQRLTVYPVPAKDWLYIKKPDDVNVNFVEIYDTLGRKMLQSSATEKIDITSLAQANYFIIVNTDRGTVKKFLIVE
jgi:alpha-tubulin suppressor-like RCC1 family protein